MAILLAAAIWLQERDLLLAIGAIYLSMLASSLQAATFNSLQGAEVTPTQFADIYRLVQQLRERFHAPPTRVFVLRSQSFVAQPLGIKAPYVIVIPHALKPVPRKVVINYRSEPGAPEYIAVLSDWKFPKHIAGARFTPQLPKDAKRIEFLQVKEPQP